MAKQTSFFTFTGKAGNMIGYYRDGKHYFRGMPETVRQTTATRRAAQRFGAASSKGRLIRSAFAGVNWMFVAMAAISTASTKRSSKAVSAIPGPSQASASTSTREQTASLP
ncbi:hypothetical protein [Chitinophaga sp. XS-30]|uniref:hypothetical protein n=1 Tax=Chitinophaga sp. XS-30 TaxID=2604421 RepID=UPI0011DD7C30|nr:hypothetical protein [Chitinophaga sp. XS-30]QEH42433.1 hypothetical protein FW415_16770 [Chitinophaga sp. XS-30]